MQLGEIYKTANNTKTKIILAKNEQNVFDNEKVKMVNYISDLDSSDNDKSIITLLVYKDFKMLFTGDAGIKALKNIEKYLPQNIDILKVPHHGAVGVLDKEIVKSLNPKYSIVSVGENKFGHPSLYTLSLLNKSSILRTDVNNSILIKVNNNGYKVLTYSILSKRYVSFSNALK